MKLKEILSIRREQPKSDDVADLELTIANVRAEEASARAELGEIASRRNDLLMTDDDDALDRDARRAETLHRQVEKAAIALPPLAERLKVARDLRLRERRAVHRVALIVAFEKLKADLEQAVLSNEEAIAAHESAHRELGHGIAASMPRTNFGGTLTRESVAHWVQETTRGLGIGAKPSAPVAAAPAAPQRPNTVARTLFPPAPAPAARKRPVKRVAPASLAPGTIAVVILRGGVEIAGEQYSLGDEIAVPLEQARSLVQNNAAAFVDPVAPVAEAAA